MGNKNRRITRRRRNTSVRQQLAMSDESGRIDR
jgi:hypothetical protein